MTLVCDPVEQTTLCSVDGCKEWSFLRGMCGPHYARARKGARLDTELRTAVYPVGSECTVKDCKRKPIAKGMCGLHYQRQARGFQLDAPVHGQKRLGTCKVEACDQPINCRGYCHPHYRRYRRGLRGAALEEPFKQPIRRYEPGDRCAVGGCERPPRDIGMCAFHAHRKRYGVPLEQPLLGTYRLGHCDVDGCQKPIYARRKCQLHYMRTLREYPLDAERPGQLWQRRPAPGGYIRLTVPVNTPGCIRPSSRSKVGTMLEHRYVMQCHVGRPLLRKETVHHKDGNRENNDLENLELRSGAHGQGINIIDGIESSLWWIGRYAKISKTARKLLVLLESEIACADAKQLELWRHQVALDEKIIKRAGKRK